ncbi:MAG: hypothetical protein ACXWXF_07070 [Aeromicrobium sp.]
MNDNELTRQNKIGLALAGLLGLADIPSILQPTPDGEVGPPLAVLALGTVCGIVTVAAVILAWVKANRGAIRIAAGARILSMLTALPAFFVDVPAAIKALVAVMVIVSMTSVVLMLSPARRSAPVLD